VFGLFYLHALNNTSSRRNKLHDEAKNMAVKYLRYRDLVERQIVNNRTTLQRWIRDYNFPAGLLLGPNSRAWPADQVEAWLAARAAETESADAEVKPEAPAAEREAAVVQAS
jgi:predicted DNA-binding transcriptional regulator AlpA